MASDEDERKSDSDTDAPIPPPGEGLSEEIFEVEKILSHVIDDDQVLFFKVRWKNYGEEDDSWEPADNLGSAGAAIQKYWDNVKVAEMVKKAKKEEKKKANKRASTVKSKTMPTKKPRPSREERQRAKSSTKTPEPDEPESEENERSDSEDEQYEGEAKNKKKKVLSKGALKAFDTPKKSTRKEKTPPLNNARKAAIDNRKSWLYDGSSDSDEDEIKPGPKEEPKKDATPPPVLKKVEKPTAEPTTQIEHEDAIEVVAVVDAPESAKAAESKHKKHHKKDKKKDKGNKKKEKHDAKEVAEVDQPSSSHQNGENTATTSMLVVENRPRIKIKFAKPEPESAKVCSKDVQKILTKYKRLEDVPNLKEIDKVEGVMLSPKGTWNVMVRDIEGVAVVMSAEEAYTRCGWALVQYLLSRSHFQ